MFGKVLVANRGEIAIRVMRTLEELGIGSVAVYSEPDRDAPHARRADEAFLLGPGPANESYLVVEKIIEVAQKAGAGLSSITFWWRRWTEQSRSNRCTTLPCESASTCTSTWRGSGR